jgi:hypothetical protein
VLLLIYRSDFMAAELSVLPAKADGDMEQQAGDGV